MNHDTSKKKLHQKGAALLALLFLVVTLFLSTLIPSLSITSIDFLKQQKTSEALMQAKEALIASAITATLSSSGPRPGDLPCPDRDNDGRAESSCGNKNGSRQEWRLARLPWLTLGLTDLRDASGERLWYAVSNHFKNNTRTAVLNSDTPGTITIRDGNGNITHNACTDNGVVAVLIAPGAPIVRQDGLVQDRSTDNINHPKHYLDIVGTEDNADFSDLTTSDCVAAASNNGFFSGPVVDEKGRVTANDTVLVITRDEIMAAIEKRVAREVLKELSVFFEYHQYFPRPADLADESCLGTDSVIDNCLSAAGNKTGRLPATPQDMWPTPLLRGSDHANPDWFQVNGWREMTLYAVADACITPSGSCQGSNLLAVATPGISPQATQPIVIVSAGRKLAAAQSRTSTSQKATITNYLEDENATNGDNLFARSATTVGTPFNDQVFTLP